MINHKLIEEVLETIKQDVLANDLTALEELLQKIPEDLLFGYCCEGDG